MFAIFDMQEIEEVKNEEVETASVEETDKAQHLRQQEISPERQAVLDRLDAAFINGLEAYNKFMRGEE